MPKGFEERAIALFEGMIERGIKKRWWCRATPDSARDEIVLRLAAASGCRMVFMGTEAEDESALESMDKRINLGFGADRYREAFRRVHRHGISIPGAFIFGADTDTPEGLRARTEYILNSGLDSVQMALPTPFPGTGLFDRMEKEGRLLYTGYPKGRERHNVTEVVFRPAQMTEEELWALPGDCWKLVLSRPAILGRSLKNLLSTRDVRAGLWGPGVGSKYRRLGFSILKERSGSSRQE